jgi:hypothetical protein
MGLPVWKDIPETFWDQAPSASSLPTWLLDFSSIATSPFQSLFQFLIRSLTLYFGAYLLISKDRHQRDEVHWKPFMKIAAICSTPALVGALLGFLPWGLNNFIAYIYAFILTLLALQVRYRISGLRAFGVLILPSIISAILIGLMVLFGLILVVAIAATLFGGN